MHTTVPEVEDNSKVPVRKKSWLLPEKSNTETEIAYIKRVATFVLKNKKSTPKTGQTTRDSNIRHSIYMESLRQIYYLYNELSPREKEDPELKALLRQLKVIE